MKKQCCPDMNVKIRKGLCRCKCHQSEQTNFIQVGRTIECSNCHPEKMYAICQVIEKELGVKCKCICHDKSKLPEECKLSPDRAYCYTHKGNPLDCLPEDWEKEFEKKFCHKGEDGDQEEHEWAWTIQGSYPTEIKSFIRRLLLSQEKQVRGDILKRMPLKMGKCNETGHDMITQYVDGYNQALDDLISRLKGNK